MIMTTTTKRIGVTAIVMLLAACSSAGDTTTTTRADTTSSTAPETTTTTTTAPASTTTTQAPTSEPIVVFMLDDSGGNGTRQGPFLYPVSTTARGGGTELEQAIRALVGTTGFETAIPEGSRLDSAIVEGTTAVVDMSDEFASGGGSTSVLARLAQLTYTATSVDGVDSVRLVENGEPVTVFSSEGVVLDEPMTRDGFQDFLPGILVEDPAAGSTVTLPLAISGVAAAFEGVFQMQILDGNEVVFEPDFVQTDNGMGFGAFEVTADFEAEPGTKLMIRVWEFSAKDGSVISERFVPVTVGD